MTGYDVSSTPLHRFCSNLTFNQQITIKQPSCLQHHRSHTNFIDVSVWNQELQIHSVHRQTACSVNHVLNTTWRQLVGKKNAEPDSLSCHNSRSHSVIGLPHSTSSWVDWTSAAPQLSSRVCVGGALGSITHFMLSGVSDTLQCWRYDWRRENQPPETFMCDVSERQKMIFWFNSFSSCFHRTNHENISSSSSPSSLWRCEHLWPLWPFVWKTIVCHCMSQVWANQMWILILQHITQGLLMWRSMRGAASIWKAAPLLIKPRPRVFTQHFWFHLELAAVTGQLMSLITL